MGFAERILRLLGWVPQRRAPRPRRSAPIPAAVAARLHPDNDDDPLFPKLRSYGRGKSGVTLERESWWAIRDEHGRVVGGAVVDDMGDDHPVSIDVAVDPAHQGEGWATRLYAKLEARGIDMEPGSSASLAHCTMTPDGYRFMLARRRKGDPDAEAEIVATASVCPGCGATDDKGRPLSATD